MNNLQLLIPNKIINPSEDWVVDISAEIFLEQDYLLFNYIYELPKEICPNFLRYRGNINACDKQLYYVDNKDLILIFDRIGTQDHPINRAAKGFLNNLPQEWSVILQWLS